MIKWWGQNVGPHCDDPALEMVVPIGGLCDHCKKIINPKDNGISMPFFPGWPTHKEGWYWIHYHHGCWMIRIVGPNWKEIMRGDADERPQDQDLRSVRRPRRDRRGHQGG